MPLSPDDIDALYRGHSRALLVFFARRVCDPESALDLMAETFAVAVAEGGRFRGSSDAESAGWLYGIARNQLSGWYRRGHVERRALQRMGIERRELTDAEYERIVDLAGLEAARRVVADGLASCTEEARSALQLRVVEERSYAQVAEALGITEPTARTRVSRALRSLGEYLAAEETASDV